MARKAIYVVSQSLKLFAKTMPDEAPQEEEGKQENRDEIENDNGQGTRLTQEAFCSRETLRQLAVEWSVQYKHLMVFRTETKLEVGKEQTNARLMG